MCRLFDSLIFPVLSYAAESPHPVSLCFHKEGTQLVLVDCPVYNVNGDPAQRTQHQACGGIDMYDAANLFTFVDGGASWETHPDQTREGKYDDCLALLKEESAWGGNIAPLAASAKTAALPRAMAAGKAATGATWTLTLAPALRQSKLGVDLQASLVDCFGRVLPGQALQTPDDAPEGWMFSVSFGLDYTSKAVILKAKTGNYQYMLDVVASSFKSAFGFKPQEPASNALGPKASVEIVADAKGNVNLLGAAKAMWSDAPAVVTDVLWSVTFASLVCKTANGMDSQGLRLLAVGMPGTVSFGSLLSGMGVPNAASLGDILTVTATTVLFVPGSTGQKDLDGVTLRSPGLTLSSVFAVPALSIPALNVTVSVAWGAKAAQMRTTLRWINEIKPIQHVTIQGMQLEVVPDGLVGTANGTLLTAPVTVLVTLASKAAQASKSLPAVSILTVAKKVEINNIVTALWPGTPDLIRTMLAPINFAELRVRWDTKLGFGISGNPDLSSVPELRKALDFLHLGPDAIVLRANAAQRNQLELAVAKSWTFRPGAPFVGDAAVGFDLAVQQVTTGLAARLQASFAAVLRVDIFENPLVYMQCQAGFTFSSVASSLNLGVSFTGQMSIRGFPFIQLRVLTGSLSVSPNPLAITAASLRVEGTLLQTNITTELVYEAKRGIFGMEVSVDSFSLQDSLEALGIKANLGSFNVAIRDAHITYASVDISVNGSERLRQGLFVAGNFSARGLTSQVAFAMDTNGFHLATELDFTVMMNEFYDRVATGLKEIGIDLRDICINIRDAFRLEVLSIDLTVTRMQQAFQGGLRMVILGQTISITVNVDVNDIVKFFVETASQEVFKFFTGACTRDTHGRGIGHIPTGCEPGRENFSGLCYKHCTQDWQYGVYGRDNRCYQHCPPGYNDDEPVGKRGLSCSKLECDPGYRYDGVLMCIKNCRSGWSSDGALLCYEDCPSGWSYVALSCQRWACKSDEDDNGAGLCYQKCARGYESDGAFLCRGPCPDGYNRNWLTCFRGYAATRGKGCCCTFFGCCGCRHVRSQMHGNHKDWYDAGCFCARNARTVRREIYWRKSRTKLTSYIRSSYFTSAVGAVKSFWRQIEDRGVGYIPNRCTDSEFPDYDAGLCYKRCAPGYDGVGPICWSQCPQGYISCGTFCVPKGNPLGCAAFIGATYKKCGSLHSKEAAMAIAHAVAYGNATAPAKLVSGSPKHDALVASALPTVNSIVEGTSTIPTCLKSLSCFCKGVKSGLRFPNPFTTSPGFIVCHAGGAIATDCGPGATFDASVGGCAPSAAAMAAGNPCIGARDGVHARKNSTGGYEAYVCKGGQQQTEPKVVARPSKTVAQAVPAGGKLPSQDLVAKAAASKCNKFECFCQGKADGLYLDTLAPGHAAMEGFANSTLAKGELDSAYITRVAAAYRSYVRVYVTTRAPVAC
ncbi:Arabinogalactan endo-1,4-beta-galactosidase isoform A [Micractinium conductrix]|uniref:Arabinogalactan endo-1,4-beta-galactosidase isoform A n=1 Tax=Micractinium conductrix TaxID=554055 RepID=A0A2P6V083_9CHLO|nr:Arabinogalactan endo-1,4-beta-galactosidase isoform A [Micractinium conductrix]|eukprot:PSC67508.1 Arabinogalactan endo-1,4-beta-galactosidase isoform A [Micractinium conductrix]